MKSVISTISYYTVNAFLFLDKCLCAAICLLKNTAYSRNLGEASHASAAIWLLTYMVYSRRLDATCVRCHTLPLPLQLSIEKNISVLYTEGKNEQ